jgi:hypothetical protein
MLIRTLSDSGWFKQVKACRYQVEPATASLRAAVGGTSASPAAKLLPEPSQMASPAEMARRHGPRDSRSRLAWAARLFPLREPKASRPSGGHEIDTNPNALPALRVFPFTLCAARPSVLRFMATGRNLGPGHSKRPPSLRVALSR